MVLDSCSTGLSTAGARRLRWRRAGRKQERGRGQSREARLAERSAAECLDQASGKTKTAAKTKLKEVATGFRGRPCHRPTGCTARDPVTHWLAFGLLGRDKSTVETNTVLRNTQVAPALGPEACGTSVLMTSTGGLLTSPRCSARDRGSHPLVSQPRGQAGHGPIQGETQRCRAVLVPAGRRGRPSPSRSNRPTPHLWPPRTRRSTRTSGSCFAQAAVLRRCVRCAGIVGALTEI